MSFYKKYQNRKDRRKEYRKSDSRAYDSSCKNNCSCQYCKDTRTYFDKKERQKAESKLKEYFENNC